MNELFKADKTTISFTHLRIFNILITTKKKLKEAKIETFISTEKLNEQGWFKIENKNGF